MRHVVDRADERQEAPLAVGVDECAPLPVEQEVPDGDGRRRLLVGLLASGRLAHGPDELDLIKVGHGVSCDLDAVSGRRERDALCEFGADEAVVPGADQQAVPFPGGQHDAFGRTSAQAGDLAWRERGRRLERGPVKRLRGGGPDDLDLAEPRAREGVEEGA